MIFGKIDYINLLPFYIYVKKFTSNRFNQILHYKKSYPAKINYLFEKRKINAAFISSIKSKNKDCFDLGIAAKDEVMSVLVKKGSFKKDSESETSNVLAKILGVEGEVIIGDKALKRYFKEKDLIDLAKVWNEKYKLPFVFARFCINKNQKYFKSIIKGFKNKKIKIPNYILKKYASKVELSNKKILKYLEKISYNISYKEKRSINKFFKLAKNVKIR